MRNQIPEYRQHLIPRGNTAAPLHANQRWSRGRMRDTLTSKNGTAGKFLQVQWYEPREEHDPDLPPTFHIGNAGDGYMHPASRAEIQDRLAEFPSALQPLIRERLHHIVLPTHTRNHTYFPVYGLQWGAAAYLFPLEEDGVEACVTPPPLPMLQEMRRYGARWRHDPKNQQWLCQWNTASIRDFYLENVLPHEIGHILDNQNASFNDRERYANHFAIQHGHATPRFTGQKQPHNERRNRRHSK